MPTLADLRSQYPVLDGLDDENAVDFIQKRWYPNQPVEAVAKAVGYTPPTPPPAPRSIMSMAKDTAIGLAQGGVAAVQAPVGLADLATGGQVGKFLDDHGVNLKDASDYWGDKYSDAQKAVNAKVGAAFDPQPGDFTGQEYLRGAGAAIMNPSSIYQGVLQSAPSMVEGGIAARGFMAAARALRGLSAADQAIITALPAGQRAAAIQALTPVATAVAPGFGEGIVTAGQQAEQIRTDEKNPSGLLDGTQALLAGGSGAMTGLIAGVTSRLAKKIGLEQADNLVAGIHADPVAGIGKVRGILGAGLTEGTQEFLQSAQEQMAQNVAVGDDVWKGVSQQAVMGALTGAAQGSGSHAAFGHSTPGVADPSDPVDPHTPPEAKAASAAAMGDIMKAGSVDEALDAFSRTQLPSPIPTTRGVDGDAAMARLAASQGATPAPQATVDPETGELVPAATFKDRLAAVRTQLEDSRVRQHVRDTAGPDALNDLLHFAAAADNPNLPGNTSDRMVAQAEGILAQAQQSPVPGAPAATPSPIAAPVESDTDRAVQATLPPEVAPIQPAEPGNVATPAPVTTPESGNVATPDAAAPPGNVATQVAPEAPAAPAAAAAPIEGTPQRQGAFNSADEAAGYISRQRRDASINLPAAIPKQFADGSWGITTDEKEVAASRTTDLAERAAKLRGARAPKPNVAKADARSLWEGAGADQRELMLKGIGKGSMASMFVGNKFDALTPSMRAKLIAAAGAEAPISKGAISAPSVSETPVSTPKPAETAPNSAVSQGATDATRQVSQPQSGGQEHPPAQEGRLPAEAASGNQPVDHGPGQTQAVAQQPGQEGPRDTQGEAPVAKKGPTASQRARQRMKLDVEKDTMLQALAKLGGISRDVVQREFGMKPEELKQTVSMGGMKGYPFRKTGGMGLDRAIEALHEAGYFRGVADEDLGRAFEEAIFNEIGGNPTLSAEGEMRRGAEMEAERQLDQQEKDAEEALMREVEMSDREQNALPDDWIDTLGSAEDDAAGTMRALGFTEEEIANELDENGRVKSAQAGASQATQADDAGGSEARPALALTSPTREDLAAAEQRGNDATAADNAEQRRLADKAKADAARGDFTLTGSDHAADANPDQKPLLSIADEPRSDAFKRWSNDAPLVRSAEATTHEFKTGEKVVVEAFHGTGRPDRVGNKFLRKRATSGPMAYFTSDPEIASNYATGKPDTSLNNEDTDFGNWFKVKMKGDRSTTPIDRAWYRLTPEQRATISERMGDIRLDDNNNVIYEKGGGDLGNYEWELKQTQRGYDRTGDPLKAAMKSWLESGAIFNDEQKFMEVLKLAGFPMDAVSYDSPHDAFPFVYKTYVAMQHPLVVGDMPLGLRAKLLEAAKSDRSRPKDMGGDAWDKNKITLREWVKNLSADGTTSQYVWTQIPDKVSEFFRSQGYDGIVDTGGKGGDKGHLVYVPFGETQVKSALGNKGTFDGTKNDIRASVAEPGDNTQNATYGKAPASHVGLANNLSQRLNFAAGGPVFGRAALFDAVAAPRGDTARARELAALPVAAKRLFGYDAVLVKFRPGVAPLFNGAMSDAIPGTVFVSVDSKKPLMAVLGHELLHQLRSQQPEVYRDLQARLNEVIHNEEQYRDKLDAAYQRQGASLPSDWLEELHADIVGDRFTEPEFWQDMATRNDGGLYKRVVGAILKFLDGVIDKMTGTRPFGTEQYLTDVQEARAAVAEAFSKFSASATAAGTDGISLSASAGVPLFSIADPGQAGNVASQTTDNIWRGVRGFNVQAARNAFLDTVKSESKIGLWGKTIGTQYAKAEANPTTFKPVFDAVQDFIKDTSLFANAAQDLAPSIFPRLDSFADLKAPNTPKADTHGAGQALWAGTLKYGRDASGKLVEKAGDDINGAVFTRDELKSVLKLTDKQADIYLEARAAIDQSLDDLVKTEMVNIAGAQGSEAARQAMAEPTAARAAAVLKAAVPTADALHALLDEKTGQVEGLKQGGYAPLMRFGKHTLHVTDGEDKSLFFGTYETNREANAAKRALQADPTLKDANFSRGLMSEQAFQMYQGLPMDALELFAKTTGNADNPVYQDFLKLTKSNRSVMKRLIARQGIAGFNENMPRVLASFITSNSRSASGNANLGRAREAVENIPKENGDIKDEAVKLVSYVQNPTPEASAMRGWLFTSLIGGSVASAAVNLTQPVAMTLPKLSQFFGVGKAAGHLLAATRGAASGNVSPEMQALFDRNADLVSPQEIHHLQAEAMNRAPNPFVRKAAFVWGGLFSLAEQFNRRVTFMAAYNGAVQQKIDNPEAFARKMVIETQGLYNKGNKPNFARGPIGATVMTFKQYSIHYLEFLNRMWHQGPEGKKAVGVAVAILLLTAGSGGLPFADDLDDLLDTLGQAMGYDFSSKRAKREFIANTLGLGDVAAAFAQRGISGLAGVPIDVSVRMGMGNLIPGTGILLRSDTDHSRDVLEFAGAAGGMAQSALKAGQQLLAANGAGDVAQAGLTMAPQAIQNLAKAVQMWNTGEYRNGAGKKVADVDGADAIMKGIGFQPNDVATPNVAINEQTTRINLAKAVQKDVANKWAQALNDGDRDGVEQAKAELRQWNTQNPGEDLNVNATSVLKMVRQMRLDAIARTTKQAPKAMRQEVAEALR